MEEIGGNQRADAARTAATDGSALLAGVELGGTKCICTLATGPESIMDQRQIPTTDPQETLAAIEGVLDGWSAARPLAGLGIGSFGPLDLDPASPDFGFITATTKKGWQGTDVAQRLSRRYRLPTAIDTDVAGAALAEGRWGGAIGLRNFVYVTVGTGVGAGIIVDGRPVRGFGHPEAGHLHVARLPGDHWPGACAYHGDCVEGLASGTAIEARCGRPAGTILPEDPVWQAVAHAIAGLCHSLVATVAPERILIGGGVINRRPSLLPDIRQMLVQQLAGYGDADRIARDIERYVSPPLLADQAGPLGAVALGVTALAHAPER